MMTTMKIVMALQKEVSWIERSIINWHGSPYFLLYKRNICMYIYKGREREKKIRRNERGNKILIYDNNHCGWGKLAMRKQK